MIKVGIIADTHDVLRDDVLAELQQCDYIIHAGDIVKKELLEELQTLTEVFGVRGNNDHIALNEEEYFKIGNYTFYLIHQLGDKQDVDFYIYGHSHQLACYQKRKTLYINPGSCGQKRFSLPLTYVILQLHENSYEVIIKECQK